MKLKRVTRYLMMALATAFVTLAGVEGHAFSSVSSKSPVFASQKSSPKYLVLAQASNKVISPTQAVRAAMGTAPRGKVVSIQFNRKKRGYEIRVKVRGGLLKLLVDGRTGGVRRLSY